MANAKRMAAVTALALSMPATAMASAPANHVGPSTLAASFTTARTGAPTGLNLVITYRSPAGPGSPPPPITHLDIALPAGTGFAGTAVPTCTASDAELLALGRLACPPDTQIGDGTISVDAATGVPGGQQSTDTVWFNGGDQLIEVVLAPPASVPALARERLNVRDDHLFSDIRAFPGGPPNSLPVATVTAEIYQRGDYFTTPATCPPAQRWRFTARYVFGNGTTQTAQASTPCRAPR